MAMEEIRMEQKLDAFSDPGKAFDWTFVQKPDKTMNCALSFSAADAGLKV